MTFPLVQFPKRVVYVDDDHSYLDKLQRSLRHEQARWFTGSPEAVRSALTQEGDYWQGLVDVLSRAHVEKYEGEGEAALYVRNYFTDWRRFHLTGVLIADYGMPGMNGLQLIERLPETPTRRILLTGEADSAVGIGAFNAGLIQKFIPKSHTNPHRAIADALSDMHRDMCEHMGHLIRSTLSATQLALLNEPKVQKALADKVKDLEWTEYVTVGYPFGLLGMGNAGPLQWLQIETAESLNELGDSLAGYGYADRDVADIRSGVCVSALELHMRLGIPAPKTAMILADSLCVGPDVYVGVCDLPSPVLTADEHGIDDIATPAELMRALVRNVAAAHLAAATPNAYGFDHSRALDSALKTVVATAGLSTFYRQRLDEAVVQVGVLPDVRKLIERALAPAKSQ